jgi:hypothetical protein
VASSISAPYVCDRIASGILSITSLGRVNSSSFWRSKRRIIRPGFWKRRKERELSVHGTSPNRYICEVVVELGGDVGLKASDQVDST